MVDRTGGQQGVNRQQGRPAVLIGEEDENLAGADRLGGLTAEVLDGLPQGVLGRIVLQRQTAEPVAPAVKMDQGPEFFGGQHRRGQDDPAGMLLGFLEDRLLFRADAGLQRHDHRFAQGIDGRIGHLGELLAEIVVERPLLTGEHGHGGVVAHGAGGLLAGFRQGAEQLVALLEADLIHLHRHPQEVALQFPGGPVLAQGALKPQGVVLEPLFVGMAALEFIVDFRGEAQGAGFRCRPKESAPDRGGPWPPPRRRRSE
jgi:hypothetical protein